MNWGIVRTNPAATNEKEIWASLPQKPQKITRINHFARYWLRLHYKMISGKRNVLINGETGGVCR